MNLVGMLEPFVEGTLERFDCEMDAMCIELALNPMGKLLIGVISYIYIE